jgi:hypothetical protein
MKNDDEMKLIKQSLLELERYADNAKEKLRQRLRGLSKEEMIVQINALNLSDKSLNFLCEVIALETEDYEICIAVQEIQSKRRSLTALKDAAP